MDKEPERDDAPKAEPQEVPIDPLTFYAICVDLGLLSPPEPLEVSLPGLTFPMR